jgi:hypothetical protein
MRFPFVILSEANEVSVVEGRCVHTRHGSTGSP